MAEGDIEDAKDYGSQVRNNLMKRPDYRPYCGNPSHMERALLFSDNQFKCTCGWVSQFPSDFIEQYKARWHCEKV